MRTQRRTDTIRAKLTILLMVTSGIGLLLAGVALALFDLSELEATQVKEIEAVANVVGLDAHEALEQEDAAAADVVLARLVTSERVLAARIYLASGRELAALLRDPAVDPPGTMPVEGHEIVDGTLRMAKDVYVHGRKLGA